MEKNEEEVVSPSIADELIKMADADQELLSRNGKEDIDRVVIHRNTERMKQIINEIGWPTISKVGEEGSRNAWLLIQHSDHDRKFQKKCLEMMKAQPESEVLLKHIAYLEDRLAVAEGKPQKYGTQFKRGTPIIQMGEVEDSENIDKIRAEVGLKPMAEYIKESAQFYKAKYKLPNLRRK